MQPMDDRRGRMATSARSGHCSAARTQVAAATDTSSKIRRWPRPAPRNVTFQKRFILLVTVTPVSSLVPPWNRGSPALRERGFSMRTLHTKLGANFVRTKLKKRSREKETTSSRSRQKIGLRTKAEGLN